MRTIFNTEEGSVYNVDFETKAWTLLKRNGYDYSWAPLRSKEGVFDNVPLIKIGERVVFRSKSPFTPGATRIVSTSPVIGILSSK